MVVLLVLSAAADVNVTIYATGFVGCQPLGLGQSSFIMRMHTHTRTHTHTHTQAMGLRTTELQALLQQAHTQQAQVVETEAKVRCCFV